MARKMLPMVVLTIIAEFIIQAPSVAAVPLQTHLKPEVVQMVSSGDVVPEVISSGDSTGSGVTPDLREGAVDVRPVNPGGCLENAGVLHVTGSSWNVGCTHVCECVSTPEGPTRHCDPPRCAIPMISPGCKIVPNPKRNDTSGTNCCDVVECTPVYCLDNRGRKQEVYTSWIDGELDCYCQYNFERSVAEPKCTLIQYEEPTTGAPVLNEIYLPEEHGYRRESLVNQTNETFDVCRDENQNQYSVGQTWRVECQTECACVQKGEIITAECSPFPCPIPAILPGCQIIPNPQIDTVNSLNCCDIVSCPPKLCIGRDQLLYELNSMWYEDNQACTCELNYNVNQAMKTCSGIKNV